ncbi:hypothetical protein EDD16DRAFT_1690199 [Pisolithus croceorrhizus]|nr:hypothetical protein EV401DRAFT_2162926 [Pisolithus croceorrhizus]KAI6129008.1 hypothetical protein EDD16DRAFT_1690199 [Pisolithus croceorrhizus]
MSESRQSKRRKYRSATTRAKCTIEGPGIWASCVKGKEKQTVGELYDLFESLASQLWPIDGEGRPEEHRDLADGEGEGVNVEDQIARELAAIKRPRTESRFANCQTNTPCVIFISCNPPVDPVRLVTTHVRNVQETGVTKTKYTHRLTPVSGTCFAGLREIHSLCHDVFPPFFAENGGDDPPKTHKYKVELRICNHSTLTRMEVIQEVAKCIPESYTVDLDDPEVFVLVELFKSVCGVSILKDFYRFQKFNVMALAEEKSKAENFKHGTGRVKGKEDFGEVGSAEAHDKDGI